MSLTARAAELSLIRKATPSSSVLAKRVLPTLSTLAEGGALWTVIAAFMAALGGRRGRRAGAEGMLAAVVASGLANGPLKRAIGRRRPGTGLGRFVVRQLGRAPRSPSMPSSHAAVAAGFTIAAGLASPPAAAPLSALAGLVAWSRVNAGRHYTSDVLVGLALGGAIGAAVHAAAARVRPDPKASTPPDA